MNIDRLKQQHVAILSGIDELRTLAHAGIAENAINLSQGLADLSNVVTQHLAVEDRILYPRLENSDNATLSTLSRQFRQEMASIASPFIAFSRKWRASRDIRQDPEGFRQEANTVLKRLYERMQQEDHHFYPAIEAAEGI